MLLDLGYPRHLQARLPRPLLSLNESERDGDVPNVVYSCGSRLRNGTLYAPYGTAGRAIRYFAADGGELVAATKPS
jgi:predicted GH43/DUF377 family glycosyl hydrolase